MPYDPEEQKELREPLYSYLRRIKTPANDQMLADALLQEGWNVPREQLVSKVYQCLMTYPEFKSVGDGYFMVDGRTRQSFEATPKLDSLSPEEIQSLESRIIAPREKPAHAVQQRPASRPKKKPGVKDPPPGPGLKDEVYVVIQDAGVLLTRDQIVSEVLKRGNVKKYDNIGSTIGFFLNSDLRYAQVGIYYKLRPVEK